MTVAALVVDADGRVVAANTSAQMLWASPKTSLVNRSLVSLTGASPATDSESAQWQLIKQSALDDFVATKVRPVDGGEERSIRMRLERAYGGGGSYIATFVAT